MQRTVSSFLILSALSCAVVYAEESLAEAMARPPIRAFLNEGFGALDKKAPPQTEQFGRLVGLWRVDTEMARQDGGWVPSAPGLWAFKYALGGFAVSDLWYQSADSLPFYMANLGRDYLLTANRIYNLADGAWHVSWMSNSAGAMGSPDAGSFTAKLEQQAVGRLNHHALAYGYSLTARRDIHYSREVRDRLASKCAA